MGTIQNGQKVRKVENGNDVFIPLDSNRDESHFNQVPAIEDIPQEFPPEDAPQEHQSEEKQEFQDEQ